MGYDRSRLMGVPLQRFTKEYTAKYVKPALDRLAGMYAVDPNDPQGRNSLRGRAEREVRYKGNQEQLKTLTNGGVKLVVVSAHADCSERCKNYQGRVYSLDGSSGRTDDGRHYEPIENATNVYFVSKSGKVWKNGLLGFNCRHRLIPYKPGLRVATPLEAQRKKENDITARMRQMERTVRNHKVKMQEYSGVDEHAYEQAKRAASAWLRKYYDFCKANARAIELERLKVI